MRDLNYRSVTHNINYKNSRNEVIRSLLLAKEKVLLISNHCEDEKDAILESIYGTYYKVDFLDLSQDMINYIKNTEPCILNVHFKYLNKKEYDRSREYLENLPNNVTVVNSCSFLLDKSNEYGTVINMNPKFTWMLQKATQENLHPLIISLLLSIETDDIDLNKILNASRVLINTNNVCALEYILDKELYSKLIELYSTRVIDINEVLEGNYLYKVYDTTDNQKCVLLPYLVKNTSEEDVKKVREFIFYLDERLLAVFDYMWSYNNEDRKQIIENLKNERKLVRKYQIYHK